jgi:hypothetical protein
MSLYAAGKGETRKLRILKERRERRAIVEAPVAVGPKDSAKLKAMLTNFSEAAKDAVAASDDLSKLYPRLANALTLLGTTLSSIGDKPGRDAVLHASKVVEDSGEKLRSKTSW